jgi:pre-mRNA cleavage complex 2 protein Pcf11
LLSRLTLVQDWIKSREDEEDQNTGAADGTGASGTGAAAANKPQVQYLPVPDDPPNTFCPICQEKFEMKWLDDAQEFVWMDAKKIGDRIYHASCFSEATKDGGSSAVKRGTPEPVLGKRKAEVCITPRLAYTSPPF